MKRQIVTAAGVLAAMPFLTGCLGYLIGDSTTWGARDNYAAALPDLALDYVIGRGPDETLFAREETMRQAVVRLAPQVPVNGWLLVHEGGDHDVTVEFVEYVAEVLEDDRCLGFITPLAPLYGDWRDDVSAANIKAAISAQPCHVVIDWNAVATEEYLLDGIHLNEHGNHLLTYMVKEAING